MRPVDSDSCPGERRTPWTISTAGRASRWSSTLSPMGPYRQSRAVGSLADGSVDARQRAGATQASRFVPPASSEAGGAAGSVRLPVFSIGLTALGEGNVADTDTHLPSATRLR